MANNDGFFKGFLLGGIIGGFVGLMLAPKTGKEFREELSEESQEEVLDNLRYVNLDCLWDSFVADDLNLISCELIDFNLRQGGYCKLSVDSHYRTAYKILKQHGANCDTYKIAQEFIKAWDRAVKEHSDGVKVDQVCVERESKFDLIANRLEKKFQRDLENCYLNLLRKEYEYLVSDEAIKQTINLNDYEFYADGEIC